MTESRVPIDQALPGIKLFPLPEGYLPAEAFVLVKCLDDDGDTQWAVKTTDHFNREEFLGALAVYCDVLKRELVDEWVDDE